MEIQQRLQYRIECLETELDNANRVTLVYYSLHDELLLIKHTHTHTHKY